MIDFSNNRRLIQTNPKPSNNAAALLKKAFSLQQKGDGFFVSSRFGPAAEFYRKSLESYRKVGDSQGTGLSLTRLGRAAEIIGEYTKAREAYQESLSLFQTLSDLQNIARCKAHLGNLGWATGDYNEAIKLLDEALSLYRVGEDISGQAWVHDLLGNLKLAMREDEEAERFYREAYSLVQKLGVNLENEAWNQYHMASLDFFRENLLQAKERMGGALQCFSRLKDDLGQVAVRIHLGEISCAQKDYEEAAQHFQTAIRLVLPTQCKPLLADALTGVAQLLKAKGDERKAISILMVALSHPTCRQQTKDRMVTLTMALESSFSQAELEGGFGWAKDFSLEAMASAWVSSNSSDVSSRKPSALKKEK